MALIEFKSGDWSEWINNSTPWASLYCLLKLRVDAVSWLESLFSCNITFLSWQRASSIDWIYTGHFLHIFWKISNSSLFKNILRKTLIKIAMSFIDKMNELSKKLSCFFFVTTTIILPQFLVLETDFLVLAFLYLSAWGDRFLKALFNVFPEQFNSKCWIWTGHSDLASDPDQDLTFYQGFHASTS